MSDLREIDFEIVENKGFFFTTPEAADGFCGQSLDFVCAECQQPILKKQLMVMDFNEEPEPKWRHAHKENCPAMSTL